MDNTTLNIDTIRAAWEKIANEKPQPVTYFFHSEKARDQFMRIVFGDKRG